MRVAVLILALVLLGFVFSSFMPAFGLPSDASSSLHKEQRQISFGGIERNYLLYRPPQEPDTKGRPLLVLLHGGGGDARRMLNFTGFDKIAEAEKIVVLCPDGVERHWNDGRQGISYRAHKEAVDDVGFISFLIDKVADELELDQSRVYLAGISNGAMMSMRISLELPDKFAAVAAVAGALPEPLSSKNWPDRALPLILINGTADPLVPFEGGEVHFFRKKLGRVISVEKTLEFFAGLNKCSLPVHRSQLQLKGEKSGMAIEKLVYGSCSRGAQLEAYVVSGGGHTWYRDSRLAQYLPKAMIGRNCRDINTSEIIWNFFQSKKRISPVGN